MTFFAGVILAVLSVILFLSSLRRPTPSQTFSLLWEGRDIKKVTYVLFLLIAYILLLRPLGFPVTTFVLLFLLFRVKGSLALSSILIVSLLVTAGAYLVFQVWLQVQLPRGILG